MSTRFRSCSAPLKLVSIAVDMCAVGINMWVGTIHELNTVIIFTEVYTIHFYFNL